MNNQPSPAPSISGQASIHSSVVVWAGTQIRENVEIGPGSSIGQFCYLGPGVVLGENCKIQNHALIYEPARVGNGVFIGPNVVITNDLYPRAVAQDGSPKGPGDWESTAASIDDGASLGAGVICVGPVKLGAWCMIAAGAVVTSDVPPYGLFAGVPARQIGWVSEAGRKLVPRGDLFECPQTKSLYRLEADAGLIKLESFSE